MRDLELCVKFQQITKKQVDDCAAHGQAWSSMVKLHVKWTQHQKSPEELMHKVEVRGTMEPISFRLQPPPPSG